MMATITGALNTISRMTTTPTFSPPAAAVQHSPWHSPMPYLFGGLAAMLGLIAFALLILACSYWRLSGRLNDAGERDLEAGDEKFESSVKESPVFEEKIVVIMAGDVKPTFLATPMSSRASSFGDGNEKKEKEVREKSEEGESDKPKENREENLETQQNEDNEEQS